jgi:hypothetical protein
VVGKADRRGNLYPTKQRPEQKIDAAVALMMAVGRAMAADDGQPDILEFLRNPVFGAGRPGRHQSGVPTPCGKRGKAGPRGIWWCNCVPNSF